MTKLMTFLFALAIASTTIPATAENSPMVGGAPMYSAKNIVENAVNSKDHTTLVAAVKAAGLVDTLESSGPFTVFAPTNEAFAKLPQSAVSDLLKRKTKKRAGEGTDLPRRPRTPDRIRPEEDD